MVAKIITGKSIRGVLHYNEHKVAEGKAHLILANGFAGDIERMNFNQKLRRFEHLLVLNPRVKTNTLHISLNFHPSDDLDSHKMQQIAMAYMEKIGFGDQPYLVYRHFDAAHDHLHLVTTNLTRDGNRIDLHNIGLLISEPARKKIEQEFSLVNAELVSRKLQISARAVDVEKVLYGKTPTKRAISNVVNFVAAQYKFTSLAEFNSVLRCFNVLADRGNEDSEMFKRKGLIFSMLDSAGNKVGVPIKASSLYSRPNLPSLEIKYNENQERRKAYKDELRKSIDMVFGRHDPISIDALIHELKQRSIDVAFRQNAEGLIYGLTFVDHKNKTVFNGSDLGKAYSAKAVIGRLFTSSQESKCIAKDYLGQERENTQPGTIATGTETNYLELVLARNYQDSSIGFPKRKKRKKMDQDQQLTL